MGKIGRIFSRQKDSLHHADGINDALAGNIKRRAVVHGGPQDRHIQGHRDGPVEVVGLGGNMSLIVIQGQHRLKPA